MKRPGFQWFVAWRYLMARPRRLSGSILAFTALALWVLVGVGASLWWLPVMDEILTSREAVSTALAVELGFGVTAVPVLLLVMGGHLLLFNRSWQLSGWLMWTALWGGLVGLAVLGVAGWVHETGAELPPWWAAVNLLVLQVPFTMRWLARRRRDVWSLVTIGEQIFLTGFALFLAGYGVLEVLPSLWPPPEGALRWWLLAPAAVALGLLPFAITGVSRRRGLLRAGALVLAAIFGTVALYGWWVIGTYGWVDARMLGPPRITMPMDLFIPMGIAGALVPLSLLLLGIRYVFTFFTTVSIGGVAIGSMALVIVLSVMSGFETDLREKILGSNAHILVTKKDEAASFTEYREVAKKIAKAPQVVAETPYLLSEVVIAANNNYANVIIKGVDPATIGDVTELDEDVEQEDALAKLWPLAEDGSVKGPVEKKPEEEPSGEPGADAGAVTDPAPEDMDVPEGVEPPDLSGGALESPEQAPPDEEGAGAPPPEEEEPGAPPPGAPPPGAPPPPEEPPPGAGADPAPPDMAVPDRDTPMDFSGGPPGADDLELFPEDEDPMFEPDLPAPDGDYEEGRAVPLDEDFEPMEELERRVPPRIAILPGVLVGQELVKQINLYVGQEVKIISPLGQNTPAGPVPRTKPLRVAGTFYTGMYEYDLKYIYVALGTLQDFLDLGDEVKGIEVKIEDPENTGPAKRALEKRLGPEFRIRDWKEINRSLFSALKLEKIAMFLVLAIIILVASFSIVGNLVMVVVEKTKEISIIKTLGAAGTGVMRIFVIQGFFIGLVGTALGLVLGLVTCWAGIRYGLPLDPDVYYIDRLPIHVEPLAVLAVAAAGIVISVVATLYPAYLAARTDIVQGLRNE